MLFDERGQAIYLFDKETSERPQCYDDCATAWPPVHSQPTSRLPMSGVSRLPKTRVPAR